MIPDSDAASVSRPWNEQQKLEQKQQRPDGGADSIVSRQGQGQGQGQVNRRASDLVGADAGHRPPALR